MDKPLSILGVAGLLALGLVLVAVREHSVEGAPGLVRLMKGLRWIVIGAAVIATVTILLSG